MLQLAKRAIRRHVYRHFPRALREQYEGYRFAQRTRLPNTIYLETTSACNLNCVMCAAQRPSAKAIKPSGYMALGFFTRLIDEIVRDVPTIHAIYLHKDGEPLLHPDIVAMIEYAATRHPDVTLVTNATLLDEAMARAILATPLQKIRFSVDGLTQSTFEKVRIQLPSNEFSSSSTPVTFAAVMTNIDRFLALRREMRNTTINVGIRTTEFKPTAPEVASYRAHWGQRVEFVDVAQLLSWSGEVGKEQDETREPCLAPWLALTVSWDGMLVPCCTYIDAGGHGKGNLFDLTKGSLRQALHAGPRAALMRAHLDDALPKIAPYCTSCRDWRSIPIPAHARVRTLKAMRAAASVGPTTSPRVADMR